MDRTSKKIDQRRAALRTRQEPGKGRQSMPLLRAGTGQFLPLAGATPKNGAAYFAVTVSGSIPFHAPVMAVARHSPGPHIGTQMEQAITALRASGDALAQHEAIA